MFVSSVRIWPWRVYGYLCPECVLPGYSDDRAFVGMAYNQPVSLPLRQRFKVFLEFFAIILCSEGEVYDGAVCKQSD